MEKLFNKSRDLKIFMEFHPAYYKEWGWTFEKVLRYLASFGFAIREIAKDREFDQYGNLKPIILKNPTIDQVLAMHASTQGDGAQAFLEKVS